MFDLPALKGVEEVVIGPEVVEGGARPLRIYSDRAEEKARPRPERGYAVLGEGGRTERPQQHTWNDRT